MGRKTNAPEAEGDLHPEYDLSKLKMVGRGSFAGRFRRGTNLAQLIERDRRANEEQAEVDDPGLRLIKSSCKFVLKELN